MLKRLIRQYLEGDLIEKNVSCQGLDFLGDQDELQQKIIEKMLLQNLSFHDATLANLGQEAKTDLEHDLEFAGKLKGHTERIAGYYRQMGLYVKADALTHCGSWREYYANNELKKIKLNWANFCKDSKYCPFCADRKQKKEALALSTMFRALDPKISLRFVTFTIPSVNEDLRGSIALLQSAFKKLINAPEINKVYLGAIKSTEITYSPSKGYHPHLHVLFAFRNSVEGRHWINQETWARAWQDSTGLAISSLALDVKRVKPIQFWEEDGEVMSEGTAIFGYLTKQPIKPKEISDFSIFKEIYGATYRKNMLSFHGLFKDLRKQFNAGELDHLKITKDSFEAYYRIICRWFDNQDTFLVSEIDLIKKNPADQADQAG